MNFKHLLHQIKSGYRKIRNRLDQISRKKRIVTQISLALMLLILAYSFAGFPTFTDMDEYRRIEKQNLIGPAKILGIVPHPVHKDIAIWVGETDDGITLYSPSYLMRDGRKILYRTKTENITAVAIPDYQMRYWRDETWRNGAPNCTAVLVFDDLSEAVRAEMDLTLDAYNDILDWEKNEKTYHAAAERQDNGFFHFVFTCAIGSEWEEGRNHFYNLVEETTFGIATFAYNATVRYYDKNEKLIAEYDTVIRSPANAALQKQIKEAG